MSKLMEFSTTAQRLMFPLTGRERGFSPGW
jgi:hypothetical protein